MYVLIWEDCGGHPSALFAPLFHCLFCLLFYVGYDFIFVLFFEGGGLWYMLVRSWKAHPLIRANIEEIMRPVTQLMMRVIKANRAALSMRKAVVRIMQLLFREMTRWVFVICIVFGSNYPSWCWHSRLHCQNNEDIFHSSCLEFDGTVWFCWLW